MLLTKNITNFLHGSDEWFESRKARFTSSENYLLIGDPFTKQALSYIYRKVGESITGVAIRKEIETEATIHGNVYELEAIRKYGQKKGLEYVITQKMILDENPMFSSTPDFIQIVSETEGGYNVITGEVKCPFTYESFISLSLCETPADLKKQYPQYYFQVLDQMLVCGTLKGVFLVYHPQFGKAALKEIEFRAMEKIGDKYPINDDLKTLKDRKNLAVDKFHEVRNRLLK
jgi:hypothetical protein